MLKTALTRVVLDALVAVIGATPGAFLFKRRVRA